MIYSQHWRTVWLSIHCGWYNGVCFGSHTQLYQVTLSPNLKRFSVPKGSFCVFKYKFVEVHCPEGILGTLVKKKKISSHRGRALGATQSSWGSRCPLGSLSGLSSISSRLMRRWSTWWQPRKGFVRAPIRFSRRYNPGELMSPCRPRKEGFMDSFYNH